MEKSFPLDDQRLEKEFYITKVFFRGRNYHLIEFLRNFTNASRQLVRLNNGQLDCANFCPAIDNEKLLLVIGIVTPRNGNNVQAKLIFPIETVNGNSLGGVPPFINALNESLTRICGGRNSGPRGGRIRPNMDRRPNYQSQGDRKDMPGRQFGPSGNAGQRRRIQRPNENEGANERNQQPRRKIAGGSQKFQRRQGW